MSVYFASRDGLIKIGTSRDPHFRTRALDSHLLAVAPGSYEEERMIHEWFADDRVYGEWFRPSRALLALIDGLIAEEAARNLGLAPLRTDRYSTNPSERMPNLFESRPALGKPQPHGSYLRYNQGCRCRPCTDAMAAFKRKATTGIRAAWKATVAAAVAKADAAEAVA